MIIYKLLLFVSIAIGIAGQLVLKHGMNKHGKVKIRKSNLIGDIWNIYFHRWIILGVILYAGSLPLWIMALSRLDLSYAYPMVSINFIAITLLSKFLFHEKVTKYRWLSVFTILFGVILLTMS
ncbi:MAG: EamA family transporter [Candidatus Nanoarchaeia archaeon]|jgi:drug/metabolite transporter (DMT)-like permease